MKKIDKNITKMEIASTISLQCDLHRYEIQHVINLFLDSVKNALLAGRNVEFRRFGTFRIKFRNKRTNAYDPIRKRTCTIDEHGVVIFKPAKELKDRSWLMKKNG